MAPGMRTRRGVEAARLGEALHLHDDDAAGVARRRGDRQRLEHERLALHGDVAVGVGGGAAQDRHVDRQRAVEEVLLAAQRQRLDEVLGGAGVDLAAAVARIDEGVEADARDGARLAGGDVAEEVRDHPLRQVVRLDLVLEREALELRAKPPMPADHPPHQPFVAEVVEAALLPVALAGGVDQRQVARPSVPRGSAVSSSVRDRFGEADADEAAGGDGGAVADEPDRLLGGDDLVPPR